MKTKTLEYLIIISPDKETGVIGKKGYTAFCPLLGVADDGDTIDDALKNIKEAIEVYIESLIKDKETVPTEKPLNDIITTTKIKTQHSFQYV